MGGGSPAILVVLSMVGSDYSPEKISPGGETRIKEVYGTVLLGLMYHRNHGSHRVREVTCQYIR